MPTRRLHAVFQGAELCSGAGFAMIEVVLLLAMLVRKFRFEAAGQMPVPVAHLTVRAKDGIMLRVALRDPDTTSKRTL